MLERSWQLSIAAMGAQSKGSDIKKTINEWGRGA